MGLRASKKSCPMGHYCLNGTKASSLAAFQNDKSGYNNKQAWFQDYVTGVISFDPNSYNWNYTHWPTPAVGESRTMHPPEYQCDGYNCYPGSQNIIAETVIPCPVGYYCRGGVGALTPIPKNFSTPQRCFDGFFCPRGSKHPEGSGPCPTGLHPI
jgi:hypothetical protein